MVSCLCCAVPPHRMIPDRLMVGQLTLDQPVVVRIHVREPYPPFAAAMCSRFATGPSTDETRKRSSSLFWFVCGKLA